MKAMIVSESQIYRWIFLEIFFKRLRNAQQLKYISPHPSSIKWGHLNGIKEKSCCKFYSKIKYTQDEYSESKLNHVCLKMPYN